MAEVKHFTDDEELTVRNAVRDIALKWRDRGYCAACITKVIVAEACAFAHGIDDAPASFLHELVDLAYSEVPAKPRQH